MNPACRVLLSPDNKRPPRAHLKNATAGIPVLRDWVAGTVRKTPLVIHDINGQPLFYDFEFGKTGQVFGARRRSDSSTKCG